VSPDKPTYKELKTRLARSEAIIASLTGGEIDAVLGGGHLSLLRTVEDVETMRRVRRELERLIEERTAELVQSREKYRRVVDNIHDALITEDVQGRVTYVNDRFLQMYGFSPEKASSLRLEDYVAPEWRSVLRDRHDRRMRGEDVPPLFEYEAVRPDGERFWVEELVTPDVENGKIIGSQSSIRDITERKKVEAALRNSETGLAEAQRIAHLGSWEWNIVENKLFWSDEVYRIFGIKPQKFEFTYDTFLTFVHPDDRELVKETVKESLEGKRSFDIEHRIIRRDGTERFVHERGEVNFDGGGSPVRMLGMVQDITERKSAQEIIFQFKSTLDQILDAVFMFDPETLKFIYVNHGAIDMTGYSQKELLKITPLDIIPEFTEDSFREILAQLLNDDKASLIFEIVQKTKSGSLIPVEIFLQYIVSNGESGRFAAIARDISDRKRAEKAIEESILLRKELEHISRVITLSGLTASIAHELNQPLAAIRSNAQAAVRFLSWDSPDIEEVRKALADIIKDNRRATDVIHRLRSLVKRETFEKIVFDVNTTAHEIIPLLYNEVLEYNISIEMELADNLPPVYGDRIAVSQVILNLLLNGIQAMAGLEIGPRELVVRTRQTDSTTIEFSVRDSGNGIGEDQKEKIFEPFYTTKADGMGMGLVICRSIIEANDGLIWFTNEPDHGATFHFTLPVSRKA